MYEFPPGTVPWTPPFTARSRERRLGAGARGGGGRAGGGRAHGRLVVVGLRAIQLVVARDSRRTATVLTWPPFPGGGGGLGLGWGMAEFLLHPGGTSPGAAPRRPVRAAGERAHAVPRRQAVAREKLTRVRPPGHRRRGARTPGGLLRATTRGGGHGCRPAESARQLARRRPRRRSGESAHEEIREATHRLGWSVVLDFVGSDETLGLAARSVRILQPLFGQSSGWVLARAPRVLLPALPYEVTSPDDAHYGGSAPSSSRFSKAPGHTAGACCMRK